MSRFLLSICAAGMTVACAPSKPLEQPAARPVDARPTAVPVAPAGSATVTEPETVDPVATVSAPPTPNAAPLASSAVTPEPAPSAPPVATSSAAQVPPPPPLGPFEPKKLPTSKLALIEAVDAALQARSADALGALVADGSRVDRFCPALPAAERQTLIEDQMETRRILAERFAQCLELADWSQVKRVALNYGSRKKVARRACSRLWKRHESSEMYYDDGTRILKVSIRGATQAGGLHALGRVSCYAKKPELRERELAFINRLRRQCPHLAWPRVTQARRGCPR